MPRKNHGMWYEVHPTPVKGVDGKNLVYVLQQWLKQPFPCRHNIDGYAVF